MKAKQKPLAPVFVEPSIAPPKEFAGENSAFPLKAGADKEAQKVFIAYELGDDKLASKLITDFLTEYPNNPLRHRVRLIGANIMNKNGDAVGALAYIKKILTDSDISNEDFTDTVLLLGSIAREKKQYDSYIQTYLEQAYFRAAEPTKSKLAFYLGYLFLNKKDFTASSKYFNNVIGEDGVLGRADLYAAQEKLPETINTYIEFLDQFPVSSNYEYVKNRFFKESLFQAASLSARGYTDAALSVLQKIVDRFPEEKESDEALLEMSGLYERKLDPEKMKSSLEKIISSAGNTFYDPEALFRLGKLAFSQDKYPEALGYFRVLTEKYPTSPLIKETMDWQRLILDAMRE